MFAHPCFTWTVNWALLQKAESGQALVGYASVLKKSTSSNHAPIVLFLFLRYQQTSISKTALPNSTTIGHPSFFAQQWLQRFITPTAKFAIVLANVLIKIVTIISKRIVCVALGFQTKIQFIKMRATPFVSFSCWNDFSVWLQMLSASLNKGAKRSTNPILPIGWQWSTDSLLYLQFKPTTWALLPTQTHQLRYLASRTSFFDTTGVGPGKFLGMPRIFARISPNLPAKFFSDFWLQIFSHKDHENLF